MVAPCLLCVPCLHFFCATGVDVGRIYGLDAFNEAL